MSSQHVINTILPRNIHISHISQIPQAPPTKTTPPSATKRDDGGKKHKFRTLLSMNKAAQMQQPRDRSAPAAAVVAPRSSLDSTASSLTPSVEDKMAAQRDWLAAAAQAASSPRIAPSTTSTARTPRSSFWVKLASRRDYAAAASKG